jgi:hypothetical protein
LIVARQVADARDEALGDEMAAIARTRYWIQRAERLGYLTPAVPGKPDGTPARD